MWAYESCILFYLELTLITDRLFNLSMNFKKMSTPRFAAIFILLFCFFLPLKASAVDYSYVDQGPEKGKCLDVNRKPGLNPGYFGDCGDLEGLDLTGRKFERVSMRGANLSKVNFSESTFINVDLEKANLNDSTFDRATFYRVVFKSAQLKRVKIRDSSFLLSSFELANLNSSSLLNSRFEYSNLSGAKLVGVNATGSSFAAIKAESLIAVGSNFTKSSFAGAALDLSNFTGSKLDDADFSRSVSTGIILDKVTCSRTNFSYSIFSQFNMIEASCSDVNLDKTQWGEGNLFRTQIIGFSGYFGHIENSILIGSVIEDSSHSESNQYFMPFSSDFRNARIQVTGLKIESFIFSVFGPGTIHPYSADQVASSVIHLRETDVDVDMLIPSDASYGAWLSNPVEVLNNILLPPREIDTFDEIRNQLQNTDVYLVPYMFANSRFLSTEVADLFREFLKKPNKRLIFLGPNKYFLKDLLGDSFKDVEFQRPQTQLDLDPDLATTLNLPGLIPMTTNPRGMFDPFKWSVLPIGSQVLYGNKTRDSAFVIRFPFEKSEIWSVGFSYGNAGFEGDAQKEIFYRLLKVLVLAKPQSTRLNK